MKPLRLMPSVVVVMSAVVLISLSTVGLAQSDAQKSDAQKSFDKLKTLAGSWEGHVTTVPPEADIEGKLVQATLRVTSMGNALMHELTGARCPRMKRRWNSTFSTSPAARSTDTCTTPCSPSSTPTITPRTGPI